MTDIADVLTAVAARIRTGFGTDVIAGRTFAYAPDSVNPPTAIVLPSAGNFLTYDVVFDARDDYELTVKILMGSQDDRTGQQALLGYLSRAGATSVRAALYGDATLGGIVSDLRVAGASGYGDVEWAGQIFFGADISVEVMG